MYIRLVEATVTPDVQVEVETVYRHAIVPELQQTEGCLFAGLLQSIDQSEELVSLTIWASADDARAYVDSGSFSRNLDRVRPYLEDTSEWKIQLSRDDTLEYAPAKQEPVIKSYPVGGDTRPLPKNVPGTRSYLRVLSLKVKPSYKEEFEEIYERDIQPVLEEVPGCRYAFLVDNTDADREMLSFTIWDDLESVKNYEENGVFQELLERVKHTLAELFQWKMALDSRSTSTSVTSEDIGISKFTLVAGKRFG